MGVDVIAKNLLEGKTCENCGYHGRGENGWFCKANKQKPEESTCVNWDSVETVLEQEASKSIPYPPSTPKQPKYPPYNPPYPPNQPWKMDPKKQFPWRSPDEDEIEKGRISWDEEDGATKYEKYSKTLEKYIKKLHESLDYSQNEYDVYKKKYRDDN
jgi:hypothetical protein